MEFNVINGELVVDHVDISYISTSSTFFIGDIQSVALASAFDTPPEEMIVGVTLPIVE